MRRFIILTLFCIAAAGCRQSDAPDDLPKLFPCSIIVTQDGKPLEEATVEFQPFESTAKYLASGKTDTAGVAEMKTYGKTGSPAGKYKVVITKNIDDDFVYAENSLGQKEISGYTLYRTVEPKYSDAKTTPHEMEIIGKGKKHEATFDVGKAIKVRM
ncbi:MAG: hypothetical protein LBQ54_15765 [Planctomycetaceae bacterium]|jgi:hypothetical protein|nr:hypothetical protein [Planctomycetaceae bacterium]